MRLVSPLLAVLVVSSLVAACGAEGDNSSPGLSDAGTMAGPDSGAANSGAGGMGGVAPDPVAATGTRATTPAAGGAGGGGGTGGIGSGGTPVTPMPSPPAHTLGYGGACTQNAMCESGVCVGDIGCSRYCDINVPNPCRAEKAFCMPLDNDRFACLDQIDTGRDEDDAIVKVGDSVRRSVSRLDDQDLFTARLDRLGVILLGVQPSGGVDVALDVYNAIGEKIGSFDDAGPGGAETAHTEVQQIGGWFLVVVRNVGNSTGQYEFAIERAAQ